MKALKEKRVSLRSLFRRSLVILSILVLVFAVGACSEDSDDGDDNPYEPPVEPPKVVAEWIEVITGPTAWSFQGCRPDLTGAVLRVKWSNNATPVIETDMTKFETHPAFADEPGVGGAAGVFGVVEPNSPGVYSSPVILPVVVPISWSSENLTGSAEPSGGLYLVSQSDVIWYADKSPEYSNMTFQATYFYTEASAYIEALADAYSTTAADCYDGFKGDVAEITSSAPFADADAFTWKTVRKTIKSVGNYPVLNTVSADSGKLAVIASIGGLRTANQDTVEPVNKIDCVIAIDKYLEVKRVEYESANWPNIFDDDVYLTGSVVAGQWVPYGNGPDVPAAIDKLFKDSDLKFRIFYNDDETDRVITYREFLANCKYAEAVLNPDGSLPAKEVFITTDGDNFISPIGTAVTGAALVPQGPRNPTSDLGTLTAAQLQDYIDGTDRAQGTYWFPPTQLRYNDESYEFGITLQYVPINFNDNAYVTRVTVPLTVLEFQGAITIEKTGVSNVSVNFFQSTTDKVAVTTDFVKAINEKWVMTAEYTGGVKKTVPFTLASFGEFDGTDTYEMNHTATITGGYTTTPSTVATAVLSAPGQIRRNWPIPVQYRGERVTDEEETVVVDVLYHPTFSPTP